MYRGSIHAFIGMNLSENGQTTSVDTTLKLPPCLIPTWSIEALNSLGFPCGCWRISLNGLCFEDCWGSSTPIVGWKSLPVWCSTLFNSKNCKLEPTRLKWTSGHYINHQIVNGWSLEVAIYRIESVVSLNDQRLQQVGTRCGCQWTFNFVVSRPRPEATRAWD